MRLYRHADDQAVAIYHRPELRAVVCTPQLLGYKDWVAVMMFPSSSSAGPRGARICASYAEVRDDRPAVPVRPNAEADGTARTGRRVAVGNRMSRPVRTPAPGGMDRFVRPVRSGRFDVDDKSPPQKRPSPLPLSENHLGGAVLDTAEPRRTSRVGVPQGTHPAGTPAEYRGSPVDSAAPARLRA